EQLIAVLAKVLREEAPHVRALRPELPDGLDELITRMLAKNRDLRPADGGAVIRELARLERLSGGPPPGKASRGSGGSAGEQRLVSVLLGIVDGEFAKAEDVVRRFGADSSRLASRALLVTFGERGDRQVNAAACALALSAAFPDARIAL